MIKERKLTLAYVSSIFKAQTNIGHSQILWLVWWIIIQFLEGVGCVPQVLTLSLSVVLQDCQKLLLRPNSSLISPWFGIIQLRRDFSIQLWASANAEFHKSSSLTGDSLRILLLTQCTSQFTISRESVTQNDIQVNKNITSNKIKLTFLLIHTFFLLSIATVSSVAQQSCLPVLFRREVRYQIQWGPRYCWSKNQCIISKIQAQRGEKATFCHVREVRFISQ